MNASAIEVLLAARRIADCARDEGALAQPWASRLSCNHMGGVLADAILQAGLNYSTVVRPRVLAILRKFPERNNISALVDLVLDNKTAEFLDWKHPEKISRFEDLVYFLNEKDIKDVFALRESLMNVDFCDDLKMIRGIGPKTVDYMSCLVGIDSIAVDRHVRNFARRVGVLGNDYYFLRKAFCFAADLLELPRRDFDSWIWRQEAIAVSGQLDLAI